MNLVRMWINQPSTNQTHHDLHGRNVLVEVTGDPIVKVYFTDGPVHSMMMDRNCLSLGWQVKG